jgi:tRNA-specific 2-thiouridylase
MYDARRVAELLDIPFYVVDVQDYFRRTIVQFFIDEHARGRTPNPCIECNRQVRFKYLYNRAMALDADFLATGHYARIVAAPERFELHQGRDARKDQSYVLHVLTQEQMAHTLFPVGEYEKDAVRDLAGRFNLPVRHKSESQDLCFLGDGDYRRFLRDHAAEMIRPGPFLTQDGEEVGRHQGLPFYTIGQRKGLGLSLGHPVFVLEKDESRNAIIVGPREALGRSSLMARDVNWLDGAPPAEPVEAGVKIRYKSRPVPATVTPLPDGRARVDFDEFVNGITAGQGAVFYQGTRCVGGGIIADREPAAAADRPISLKVLS